ncbi:MAG: hypothetical protein KA251_07145 [Saprospiraceae bacterium]|nr:hypothetical protein [Candidatus Vicinibacter affinis]MBP6172349.1 hypothetical protein [Saprospiraceae bacterium]MBK6573818.1 hypothetical protein [Candidatus Vicinibacter affinis]MBK6821732.1 hypothetical protein [Candidatus Vicinibacter affinis]MBK7695277.1 hypothetical protein [Candidatus Vicinibacter affinis]
MNLFNHILLKIIIPSIIFSTILGCTTNKKQETNQLSPSNQITENKLKPPSSNQDTEFIKPPSVVFYKPDSLQLINIKSQTEHWIYEGSMHEYEFQIRNAKITLNKDYPELNVIPETSKRYLTFIFENNDRKTIDLNTFNDPYGLFLFNGEKSPELADMMNANQAIYFHFKQ